MLNKMLLAAALALVATGCKNENPGHGTSVMDRGDRTMAANNTNPAAPTTEPAAPTTATGAAMGDTNPSGTAATGTPTGGGDMGTKPGDMGSANAKSGAAAMMSAEMVLNKVHAINQHEIQGGQMAQKMGGKEAKAFGMKMVKDHTDADKQVMDLAKKKSVTLKDMNAMMADPAVPQAEKDQMKADMDKMEALKAMKGAEFDKAYLTAMSDGHGKALDFLRMAQAQSDDADVKALAGKLAPTVESHKAMADEDLKKVGTSKTQGRR